MHLKYVKDVLQTEEAGSWKGINTHTHTHTHRERERERETETERQRDRETERESVPYVVYIFENSSGTDRVPLLKHDHYK